MADLDPEIEAPVEGDRGAGLAIGAILDLAPSTAAVASYLYLMLFPLLNRQTVAPARCSSNVPKTVAMAGPLA
jgi:hypothetical protein